MGAMILRTTGEVIGVAGIQPLDIPGEYELGWWVWKSHWRQGFATEAAAARGRGNRTTERSINRRRGKNRDAL